MHLIIPMAGKGTRMRPHTLTTPKPLIPIINRPIVAHLIDRICKICPEKITKIGFIIHPSFDEAIKKNLYDLAKQYGIESQIYYQTKPLGTAHAIFCAKTLLQEKVIIAFADTLFQSNQMIDTTQDNIVWVKKINDPTGFGVVCVDHQKKIQKFVEKPTHFISDLAIIGIYYFKKAQNLRQSLQYIIQNKMQKVKEYQLTDALKHMQENTTFSIQMMDDWMDFGNVKFTLQAHEKMLDQHHFNNQSIDHDCRSCLIPPVWLGKNVKIKNAMIGPYVSIGDHTVIENAKISHSIVQKNAQVKNAIIDHCFLDDFVSVNKGKLVESSLGAYSVVSQ